jgi:hypothetical protein
MRGEVFIKPTKLQQECLFCERKIEKGEKYFRIVQSAYPGYRVGCICSNHFKRNELKNKLKQQLIEKERIEQAIRHPWRR